MRCRSRYRHAQWNLAEETFDWYAQDEHGSVWYFGEDSKEYENGKVVSTDGSWEAGVDSAEPGLVMEANPQIGDTYRQEYYEGEAEDMAQVISLNESVTVPYGLFDKCLVIEEWTPLEPNLIEADGGSERLELVDILRPV
ncbi:MAG: hypothetical protein MUO26_06665 [Methanotrichaceae archaeon]|nr:hypothetical protein [Methanotrichaceae archaeon]